MEPLLERINSPHDLKHLSEEELEQLSKEVRGFIISTLSKTGGHLASNLGTVELTVALHAVFDTPKDKIVWDVGHQAYAHKILTGRRTRFHTIRQYQGLSGFCKPDESEYDVFGAGHSSTSISAALGLAEARDLKGEQYNVLAVIGEVAGKVAVILDDMCDTAGTLTEAAEAIAGKGAKSVHACCSHPVLSGPAVDRIMDSPLHSVVVTDTIPLSGKAEICDKIRVLSIAELVGEAIIRSHRGDSVTSLFV